MKKGFTLLEILLVIAAIGILAAIVIVAINPQRQIEQASQAQTVSQADSLHQALEQHLIENGQYPASISSQYQSVCDSSGSGTGCIDITSELVPTYLADIPTTNTANAGQSGYEVGINQENNRVSVRVEDNINLGINTYNSVIQSSLVMHLDAGDINSYPGTGTTWADISGNGYDATIVGTNRWTSTDRGKFDFPNVGQTSDWIILEADAAQTTGSEYTLEFWMQPYQTSTRYFSSMANANNNYFILLQQGTNLGRYNGTGSISFTDREILQFTLIKDASSNDGRLYKNGEFVTDVTSLGSISAVADGGWILNQEQDSIGGSFDNGQNFRGAFMIIRLYDEAFTEQEILNNFRAEKDRYGL